MPCRSKRRRIGLAVIGAAFLPYCLAYWHANRYNWTPLNYRVELHQGEIRTPTFVADVDGRYILYVEVEPRRMDRQRLDCLLDLEMAAYKDRCIGMPSVMEVSWKLWNGSRIVQDHNSEQTWRAGEYSNGATRREIGRFEGMRGERYALAIDFHQDPSALNIANPKLVAESQQDWESFAIEMQGTFALGIVGLIAGVVLIRPLES